MSKRLRTELLSALMPVLLLAWSAHAPADNALPRIVDRVTSEKAIGVVEAVNVANRIVTIRSLARNQSMVMEVGEEARNLGQVQVGDRVIVEYHEALAVDLVKGGGMDQTGGTASAVERTAEGEKPGAGAGQLINLVATIVGINPDEPSVSLLGPNGNVVEVVVRDPAKLKEVAVGDQIIVTMVRALVLSMEPAPVTGSAQ